MNNLMNVNYLIYESNKNLNVNDIKFFGNYEVEKYEKSTNINPLIFEREQRNLKCSYDQIEDKNSQNYFNKEGEHEEKRNNKKQRIQVQETPTDNSWQIFEKIYFESNEDLNDIDFFVNYEPEKNEAKNLSEEYEYSKDEAMNICEEYEYSTDIPSLIFEGEQENLNYSYDQIQDKNRQNYFTKEDEPDKSEAIKGCWSLEQQATLIQLVHQRNKNGSTWKEISKLAGKSLSACYNFWHNNAQFYSEDQIKKLMQDVNNNRNAVSGPDQSNNLQAKRKNCQSNEKATEMFKQTLPNLRGIRKTTKIALGKWTKEEIEILLKLKKEKRSDAYMESQLNKPAEECKRQLSRLTRLTFFKSGVWSANEIFEFLKCEKEIIKRNWIGISNKMKTRDGKQCRSFWKQHFNKGNQQESWSEQDQIKLIKLVNTSEQKNYGWVQIARHFPGKSERNCFDQWVKCKILNL